MAKRARMRFPRPLADLLPEGLAALNLTERLREADIWRLWPEIVGSTVASRAQPLRIINGTLTVAVSSAPWMQELRFLLPMMKEKLNQRLGADVVKEITLKAGKVEQPVDMVAVEDTPQRKPLSPRQQAYVDEQAAGIADPELRQAFADLIRTHLETVR